MNRSLRVRIGKNELNSLFQTYWDEGLEVEVVGEPTLSAMQALPSVLADCHH